MIRGCAVKIGVLNIGQTPMPDLTKDLQGMIGSKHEFIEVGALDGMSSAQLQALVPRKGEEVTVIQLHDGSEMLAASERLYPLGQNAVATLEQLGAEIIFPACGGDLPPYEHKVRYVSTFRVLRAMIDVVLPQGTLALLVPSAEQRGKNERWYGHPGRKLVIEGASPLSDEAISQAAIRLAAHEPDLLVMTCFLNDSRQSEMVRALATCPVLLSRAVVASTVAQLVHGWPRERVGAGRPHERAVQQAGRSKARGSVFSPGKRVASPRLADSSTAGELA